MSFTLAEWLVRIAAGVGLGLIVWGFIRGGLDEGREIRAFGLVAGSIVIFVAWFEAKDRKRFEDAWFDDDDDRRGPPGVA